MRRSMRTPACGRCPARRRRSAPARKRQARRSFEVTSTPRSSPHRPPSQRTAADVSAGWDAFSSALATCSCATMAERRAAGSIRAQRSFTIHVNPVNDAPSFAAGPAQVVNEDSGPRIVPAGQRDHPRPSNEAVQAVSCRRNDAPGCSPSRRRSPDGSLRPGRTMFRLGGDYDPRAGRRWHGEQRRRHRRHSGDRDMLQSAIRRRWHPSVQSNCRNAGAQLVRWRHRRRRANEAQALTACGFGNPALIPNPTVSYAAQIPQAR